MQNFVKPEKQRALRRYLGMVNYYHRFIPQCAAKLTSLNNLLTAANEGHTRLSPKSNFDLKWDQNAESVFTESKQILANATPLVHPDPMAQINITCDASDVAVGGVLQQYLNGMWQPLSFFSKKLNPAETCYSAFDRERLAVYATIKHFRHNLEGRHFFVNTDHKPLTFVMSSVTERASLRQTQHLAFIAEFTTDIRYVKGETNFVADALSRPSVSAIDDGPVINYKELSIDQAKDAEFTRLRHSTTSTMNFKLLKSFDNQLIWCDVSTGHNRPYLTTKFRRKVFSILHGLGHPSYRATKPLINTRFVWHGMNIDIARWCRSCKGCQTAKVSRHNTPQSTAVRSSTKLATVPQQLDAKVKLSNKDKTYIAPHSRAPAVSRANRNGGGLWTYSRIPLHLRGGTPGAADAIMDSNKRNRSNIVNHDKISTDATVRKTRVGRTIQTPARFVQMVHATVAPNDIYGGPNRMYHRNNVFKL